MDDLKSRVDALSARLRLQTLITFGALAILVFSIGGADVIAKGLVEAPAWKVRTRKLDLSYVDRLVVSTDVDQAAFTLSRTNLIMDSTAGSESNIKLAEQPDAPANPVAGMLWYESDLKKLKYYDGSNWIESGAESDSWRLEYTSATTITLRGLGSSGGSISINGVNYTFASNPVLTAAAGAGTFRVYAYWNGTSVALERSTTTATTEVYGNYATKTGDATRRFVGLVQSVGAGSWQADLIRSVKNELGYVWQTSYSGGTFIATNSTTMVDIDATNVSRYGLFFANEKVEMWLSGSCSTLNAISDVHGTIGVMFDGADLPSGWVPMAGEVTNQITVTFHGTSRNVVVVSSAGYKQVKGRFKKISSATNIRLNANPDSPVCIGFAVHR
jgi:hypothetical protein